MKIYLCEIDQPTKRASLATRSTWAIRFMHNVFAGKKVTKKQCETALKWLEEAVEKANAARSRS